jgi:hypothetical protein
MCHDASWAAHFEDIGAMLNWLKKIFIIAQERAKSYFDRRVQAISFAVGDEVLLSTSQTEGHKLGERTKI